jgi:hypothetical protein
MVDWAQAPDVSIASDNVTNVMAKKARAVRRVFAVPLFSALARAAAEQRIVAMQPVRPFDDLSVMIPSLHETNVKMLSSLTPCFAAPRQGRSLTRR